jgi:hypothetical protein
VQNTADNKLHEFAKSLDHWDFLLDCRSLSAPIKAEAMRPTDLPAYSQKRVHALGRRCDVALACGGGHEQT